MVKVEAAAAAVAATEAAAEPEEAEEEEAEMEAAETVAAEAIETTLRLLLLPTLRAAVRIIVAVVHAGSSMHRKAAAAAAATVIEVAQAEDATTAVALHNTEAHSDEKQCSHNRRMALAATRDESRYLAPAVRATTTAAATTAIRSIEMRPASSTPCRRSAHDFSELLSLMIVAQAQAQLLSSATRT